MVNDEFLITQDELNRLGHLVNSIINYCFYGQLDKPELEIVKTIMLRANLTDGLASGYQDLFNDPVGPHWMAVIDQHPDELKWLEPALDEAALIIRTIIKESGLFHRVTRPDGTTIDVSLLVVKEYSAFRYIQVEDVYADTWLA